MNLNAIKRLFAAPRRKRSLLGCFAFVVFAVIATLFIDIIFGRAYVFSNWPSTPGCYFLFGSNIIYSVRPSYPPVEYMRYFERGSHGIVVIQQADDGYTHRLIPNTVASSQLEFDMTWYGFRHAESGESFVKASTIICWFRGQMHELFNDGKY